MVAILGALTGLGLLLIVMGFTRRPASAQTFGAVGVGSGAYGGDTFAAATDWTKKRIGSDLSSKSMLMQDAIVMGRNLETHALHKLSGLVFGIAFLAVSGTLATTLFGLELPLPILLAAAMAGGLGGWLLPDSVLKTEADKERVLFQQVTEAWLELTAQLVTAGADTFAALITAAEYSPQPGFVAIRNALREAAAGGEPPWAGLRKMANDRRLPFLIPFCSALELAGTTGAGSRQAILAQVEAARSKAVLEADAAAASASEKMGAPLALIGGAFMILMGYPPMAGILDTSTISGGL